MSLLLSMMPKTKMKNPKKYLESRKRYRVKLQDQNKTSNQHVESLRTLVTGMSDKIDKALEKAAEYIMALQTKAGSSMEENFCKYLCIWKKIVAMLNLIF